MEKDIQKTLLELSFSIGSNAESSKFDLAKYLQNTLPVFLEKLDLSGACVLQLADHGFQVIYERSHVENPCFPISEITERQFVRFSESSHTQSYQIIKEILFHHIFNLDNFGVLILSGEKKLTSDLLLQLHPVISMLAHACNFYSGISKLMKSEEKLKQERNLFHTIIDNIPDPIYVKDLDGRKILLNKAEADLLGVASIDAAIGKTDEDFYPVEIAEKTRLEDKRILDLKTPMIHEEGRLITRTGEELWFEGNKIPFFDENGEVLGIVGISHNITNRKKAEKEIQESEEKLGKLLHLQNLLTQLATEFINIPVENSDEAVNRLLTIIGEQNQIDRVYIFSYDFESKTMSNTHEWCAEGVSPEIDNLQIIPHSLLPSWVETHLKGEILTVPDVSELPVDGVLRQILEPQGIKTLITVPMILNGECLGFVGFDSVRIVKQWSGEEITFLRLLADLLCNVVDRKRTEKTLVTREAYLKSIFDNVPYLMWLKDTEGRYLIVNQPFLDYFSFTIHDYPIGKTAHDLWLSNISQNFVDQDNEVLKTRKLKVVEEQVDFHGKMVWFEIFRAPIIDPNGKLLGTTGIARDITSRIMADHELKKATEAAESSNIAKTRFLANMSHEIRTPLNAITGMIRLFRETSLDPSQLKLLGNMNTASENLLTVINDILDFSKIESGQITLDRTDFNINELCRRVYDANEYRAEGKNIKLQYSVDPAIPEFLKGDPVRLHQVLNNLVSNAIKFTNEGGVEMHFKLIGEDKNISTILFVVEDTGIGISPENQKRIFNSFQQEDESITRTYGGTGLGLPISKQLVELMGGELSLESTKHKGSSFFFTLNIPNGSAVGCEIEKPAVEPGSANLTGYRILLVEDNKFNQFIAQSILEKWGGAVMIAEDGQQAVDNLSSGKFDLILMDIQMPVMDGLTAAKIIRNKLNLQTPILALTANVVKGIVERCEEAGMQGYISKPFDENELYTKIMAVIGKNQGYDESAPLISPEVIVADTSRLSKMVGNDKSMLNRMILKFLEVTPAYMTELSDAAVNNDPDAISRMSHKIKSSVDLVSTDKVRDLIKQINEKSKSPGEIENLREMIKEFSMQFELLVRQLNDVVNMS